MPTPSVIGSVNRALRLAGRPETLYRAREGYYYLGGGDVDCSIYAYRLGPGDWDYVASEINDAFRKAGLREPLQMKTEAKFDFVKPKKKAGRPPPPPGPTDAEVQDRVDLYLYNVARNAHVDDGERADELAADLDRRGIQHEAEDLSADDSDRATPLVLKRTIGGDGCAAKIYHDKDWDEYRVRFYRGGKHLDQADHHTDDLGDAESTARHEVDRMGKKQQEARPAGFRLVDAAKRHLGGPVGLQSKVQAGRSYTEVEYNPAKTSLAQVEAFSAECRAAGKTVVHDGDTHTLQVERRRLAEAREIEDDDFFVVNAENNIMDGPFKTRAEAEQRIKGDYVFGGCTVKTGAEVDVDGLDYQGESAEGLRAGPEIEALIDELGNAEDDTFGQEQVAAFAGEVHALGLDFYTWDQLRRIAANAMMDPETTIDWYKDMDNMSEARKRTLPSGRQVERLDEVHIADLGVDVKPDRWYVVSDTNAMYGGEENNFASEGEALNWAATQPNIDLSDVDAVVKGEWLIRGYQEYGGQVFPGFGTTHMPGDDRDESLGEAASPQEYTEWRAAMERSHPDGTENGKPEENIIEWLVDGKVVGTYSAPGGEDEFARVHE